MDNNHRELYYDAGKSTWFWVCDVNDDIHLRIRFQLDHEVNGEELALAWKKTMKVYPILDRIPDRIDGHLQFFETDDEPAVVESEMPASPGTELTRGRSISVSYHKDSITLLAYHAVMDGTGMTAVAKTLLYHYCTIHFGEQYPADGFMLTEDREPETYFQQYMSYPLGKFDAVPAYTFPENTEFFSDARMVPEAPGKIVVGCLRVPADAFMKLCKANHSNPSAMLGILLGRAEYHLNPDDQRDAMLHMTIDFRPALGVKESIAQCSSAVMIHASRDEILSDDISSAAVNMRTQLNSQRTSEYVRSYISLLRTYDMVTTACSGVISYMGKIELGEIQKHVLGMSMVNNACNILNMVQFGDDFLLFCQFGLAAEDYMKAITAELEKLGVHAETAAEAKLVIPERKD